MTTEASKQLVDWLDQQVLIRICRSNIERLQEQAESCFRQAAAQPHLQYRVMAFDAIREANREFRRLKRLIAFYIGAGELRY